MVRQVFMTERVIGMSGTARNLTQLAFGDHDDISRDDDDRAVETGVALDNRIRVVLDELLLGNNMEEIACRDGSWSKVPVGATPDDIAACADLDLSRCTGEFATCIGDNGAVGVLDDDVNGSPDDLRFIDGAVTVECEGQTVALDITQTFWQPSGNQQIPAGAGINGLGPAVILVPLDGMRTNSDCTVVFAPAVVDKDGLRVCAPPGGDITMDCEPGDTTQVDFHIEPLRVAGSNPVNGQNNVSLVSGGSANFNMLVQWNANLFPPNLSDADFADIADEVIATLEAGMTIVGDPLPEGGGDTFSMVPGGGDGDFEVTLTKEEPSTMTVVIHGGWVDDALFDVTFSTDIVDMYGSGLPDDHVLGFCTGTTDACLGVDGGTPDPDASVDAAADASIDAPTPVDAGPDA